MSWSFFKKNQLLQINYTHPDPPKGVIWDFSTLVDNFSYQNLNFLNFFGKTSGKTSKFWYFPDICPL